MRANPTDRSSLTDARSRDATRSTTNGGFTPRRDDTAEDRRALDDGWMDPRARIHRSTRGKGGRDIHPRATDGMGCFRGVPPETTSRDSTNRATWVIRFRPPRYRSIDRRAVRRTTDATDERDRWRRKEVKQNSPDPCVPDATRVRVVYRSMRRISRRASTTLSREPEYARPVRTSKTRKKSISVPFRSHP